MEPEATRSSLPPDLVSGMRIGHRYELLRKIGIGSMGEVWAARHLTLQEEVALKIVLRDVAHDDGSSADTRFLLEARVASQLSRKTRHIVHVTDHGEDGRYAYLAMELLNGESLDARLQRSGPMPVEKVVPLIYQVARALAVAHGDGIVHRDLKPSNVFVTVDEEGKALVKILDFGIAKLRESMGRIGLEAKHSTLRGFLLGTPVYMSPEQARGRKLDHRADVWALAVIAFHLLSGGFPFDGDSPEEVFALLCRFEATPIGAFRPDLPQVMSDVFARAFAERIDQRFQSALAFAGALEQVLAIQARVASSSPPALAAISVPPRARVRDADAESLPPASRNVMPSGVESSIAAAGVPRRSGIAWHLLVGFAIALAGVTALIVAIYFEREPPTKLAGSVPELPSASPTDARDVAAGDLPSRRVEVPALPEPMTSAPMQGAVEPPPTVAPPAASAPPARSAPVATPPTFAPPSAASSPPPPSRRGDKSEVF